MKKRVISIIIAVIMMAGAAMPAFAMTGRGSADSPYLISTETDLMTCARKNETGANPRSNNYKLANDIVIKKEIVIGSAEYPFSGTFDGAGYSITIDCGRYDSYSGLFGAIAEGASVSNLTVIGEADSCKETFCGGLCGINNGTIMNCTNNVEIDLRNEVTCGGICGHNTVTGRIVNCINNAGIGGRTGAGGICGRNENVIQNCINTGTAGPTISGGICAYNYGTGTIENCISTGTVSGNGGICFILGYDLDRVRNCYFKDDTGSEICSLPDELMRAESGTEGALIDRLNGYQDESGNYPEDWFIWEKEEGGYPHFPAGGTFNGNANPDENAKCEKCGFRHSDGLLGSIFCWLVRVIKAAADFVRNIVEITF